MSRQGTILRSPYSAGWLSVLAEVDDLLREQLLGSGVVWFRGHGDVAWTLSPTLHRDTLVVHNTGLYSITKEELAHQYGKGAYQTFVSDAWPLLNPSERGPWGSYLAMRHYGHSTRLLDWTESFLTALSFAQLRPGNTDGHIWVLYPEKLNSLAHGTKGIVAVDDIMGPPYTFPIQSYHPTTDDLPEHPVAIQAPLINARMVAQRARFTLAGSSFTPLEDAYPESVKKITLPAHTQRDADRFLRLCGVNEFTLFPDHEGLMRRVRTESNRQATIVQSMAKHLRRARESQ